MNNIRLYLLIESSSLVY